METSICVKSLNEMIGIKKEDRFVNMHCILNGIVFKLIRNPNTINTSVNDWVIDGYVLDTNEDKECDKSKEYIKLFITPVITAKYKLDETDTIYISSVTHNDNGDINVDFWVIDDCNLPKAKGNILFTAELDYKECEVVDEESFEEEPKE